MESNMTDLMNAATSSLDLYEKNKSLRMNFFFHEEAIKHLARLTRVYVINFFFNLIYNILKNCKSF